MDGQVQNGLSMKNFFKNIFLVTVPISIFLFLCLEIFVRIQKDEKLDLYALTGRKESKNPMSNWANNDPYSAYSAKKGDFVVKEGEVAENKTVNSDGFISTPEIDYEKPEDRVRIVFLGGSSTAGVGEILSDKETWPYKVVEKLKRDTGRDIDFINAALGGFTTFESYGRLWSRIRFYSPDIVIVYHGWNEMYYFDDKIAEDPIQWKKNFSVDKPVVLDRLKPSWIDPFISWSQLLSRMRFYVANEKTVGEAGKVNGVELKDYFNKNGLNIFGQNLDLIKNFADQYDCELFICKQATLITNSTTKEDRERCYYSYHMFDHNAHVEAYDSIYSVIDSKFNHKSIIDVTSVSGVSEYFADHVHPTTKGTTIISNIVSDSLKNNYFNLKK